MTQQWQTNFRAEDMIGGTGASTESAKTNDSDASPPASASAPAAAPAPAPEPEAAAPEGVPTGTINEVKRWVGDDSERAVQALDAENAKENPRSSLVTWLEEVATR